MSHSDLDFSSIIITKTLLWWNGEHTILCQAGEQRLLGVRAYDNEYWYVKITEEEHDEISKNWPDVPIVDYYQNSREVYAVSPKGVIIKPPWIYKEFWYDD